MITSNFRKKTKKKKKPKQYKNKEHLDFIHHHDCCLRQCKDCFGPVQAHHLLKPWDGVRGMGMKSSDKNVVPLCLRHHIMLHKRGNESSFFAQMTGDPDFGRKISEAIWDRSPFKENEND
jgi:hypothetical protein|tara:strand:+ start:2548 stop:2907 length:360 start_codon:yes stop_codon:yes gene_type:complete